MARWKTRRWSTSWGLFVIFAMVFTLMVQAAPAYAIVRPAPDYTVTKEVVSSGPYTIGSEVEFKITVSVRRDSGLWRPGLRNVVVHDPDIGIMNHSLGSIGAGDSKSVSGTYTIQEGDANPLVNTAKVNGEYCAEVGQLTGACYGPWKPFTEKASAQVEWEEPQEPEPEPEKPKGTLTIKKVDEKGKKLGGATFEVCPKYQGKGECIEVTDNEEPDQDDRDGFIQLRLPLGKYTIRETEAPDGYLGTDQEQTVELTQNKRKRTVTFVNEREPDDPKPKGKLTIEKRDKKGRPLGGATFEVCPKYQGKGKCIEVTDNEEPDQDDRDGFIKLRLPLGEYTIRETEAPDGYQGTDRKETVTLSKQKPERTVKFVNHRLPDDPEPPTGDLIIKKYDKQQNPLPGATFEICDEDDNCFPVKDDGDRDEERELEGVIRVTGLKAGTYRVTEIEAPEGYQNSDETQEARICVPEEPGLAAAGFRGGPGKGSDEGDGNGAEECDPAEVKFYNEPEDDDTPPPPPPGRTTRTPRVDLAVTKVVDDPTPEEGQQVTFTITVTNEGPDNARNVVYSDLIPAGLTYVSHEASQGTYDPVSGEWAVGNLADGASATLRVTATVNPGTAGQIVTNRVTLVSSNPNDTNSSNNSASASVAPPQVVLVEEEPPTAEPPAAEAPPLPVTGGNSLHLLIPGLMAVGVGLYLRRRWA